MDIGAVVDVSFVDNAAAVAGGAVFASGIGVGPSFTNVRFVANSAQVGGAVSAFGFGTLNESADVVPPFPTIFKGCVIVDNTAAATGGAVESAAGQDSFISSVFEGNKAREGGAMRLAGTSSMEKYTFVENVSEDGGGAALSNIGSTLKTENVLFAENVFACRPGTFRDYNTVSHPNVYELFVSLTVRTLSNLTWATYSYVEGIGVERHACALSVLPTKVKLSVAKDGAFRVHFGATMPSDHLFFVARLFLKTSR